MITKQVQTAATPQFALEILKKGNQRFINAKQNMQPFIEQAKQTAHAQYPLAIILSCIDSRVSSELIFDQGLGDIFSVRIAGNVLNEDILGSMEFACAVAGAKLVLVLGHTGCGAVRGACDKVIMGHLTYLLDKIKPAIQRETLTKAQRNGNNKDFVNNVAKLNVQNTVQEVRRRSRILTLLEKKGDIKVVGGMYNIRNGQVTFF